VAENSLSRKYGRPHHGKDRLAERLRDAVGRMVAGLSLDLLASLVAFLHEERLSHQEVRRLLPDVRAWPSEWAVGNAERLSEEALFAVLAGERPAAVA
jgi:hypothetical protein